VWASPYSIGNLTRHPPPAYLSPAIYEETWQAVFDTADEFDLVAPQDSMGAQGNSFQNASDYLRAARNASRSAARPRPTWANIEIFETWPRSCRWTPNASCAGRHPAPWARIKEQMQNEASVLSPDNASAATLIAWEWYSCFSPNAAGDPLHRFPAAARQNYEAYKAYLANGL